MPKRITPLSDEYVELLRSPDPQTVYCGSPGIDVLPSGRIVVTDGLRGPGVRDVLSKEERRYLTRGRRKISGGEWIGYCAISDDGGKSWRTTAEYPMMHQRPFHAGGACYILGHDDDLAIMRSDDDGETWSDPVFLTHGEKWHQAPSNYWTANGCIYLVMERRMTFDIQGWSVGEMAPILMRAPVDADLLKADSWTFAAPLSFRDVLPDVETDPGIDYFGVPFFSSPYPAGGEVGGADGPSRRSAPLGWLETNVVRIDGPDHIWHDPTGRTFHLWMRAHTGGTGYACVAKAVEESPGGGPIETVLETVPSGKRILYVPCPGGQMKFHVVYDDVSRLYWLLSTQAIDSMRRPDRLPADRFNLPNNERRRLQLHFSTNMVDWCFAGIVAIGSAENASRHYAAMAVRGDDLLVVSRSGDEESKNPHDTNISTFHIVESFRELVY